MVATKVQELADIQTEKKEWEAQLGGDSKSGALVGIVRCDEDRGGSFSGSAAAAGAVSGRK